MVTAQVRRGIQYDLSSLAFAPRLGKVLAYTALHWTSIQTPLVGTHKKGNRQQVGSLDNSEIAGWLAFGELETCAGAFLTVLFTFFLARITANEPCFLQ